MTRQRSASQRRHLRVACSLELQGRKLAALGDLYKVEPLVRGQIENISRGGVCLLSSGPIPESSLVRCEIEVSQTGVAIPSLMQVRWAEKVSTNGEYRIGLQFLL